MSAIRCGLISLACLLCPASCLSQHPKPDCNRLTMYHFVYFQVPGAAVTNPSSINDSLMVSTGLCGSSRGPRSALTGSFCLLTLGGRDSLM
jgi:hypothetical protein